MEQWTTKWIYVLLYILYMFFNYQILVKRKTTILGIFTEILSICVFLHELRSSNEMRGCVKRACVQRACADAGMPKAPNLITNKEDDADETFFDRTISIFAIDFHIQFGFWLNEAFSHMIFKFMRLIFVEISVFQRGRHSDVLMHVQSVILYFHFWNECSIYRKAKVCIKYISKY